VVEAQGAASALAALSLLSWSTGLVSTWQKRDYPGFTDRETEIKGSHLNCGLSWSNPPKSFNVPKEIFLLPCNGSQKTNLLLRAVWFLNVNAHEVATMEEKEGLYHISWEKGIMGI